MLKIFISAFLILTGLTSYAQESDPQYQDPQNMRVEPENTDCHLLPQTFDNVTQAVEFLENSRFYYDQSIKTTRKSGLMQARFVSCDFKKGYLIVHYDSKDQVYLDVDMELWQQFQQTADIDGFYFKKIKNLPNINTP